MSLFIPTPTVPLPLLPAPAPYDIARGTATHTVWTDATWLFPWILDTIPIHPAADYIPYVPEKNPAPANHVPTR